jgi:hypothetical protein
VAWMKSSVFIHLTQLPSNPILFGFGQLALRCDFSETKIQPLTGCLLVDIAHKNSIQEPTHSVKISDNIASPNVYKCPITSSQRISADCAKILHQPKCKSIALAETQKHSIGLTIFKSDVDIQLFPPSAMSDQPD